MRPIRAGQNPIPIPFELRTTEPALAQWCNQTRQSLMALRDRLPQAPIALGGGGGTPLRWEISVSKGKVYVGEGTVIYIEAYDHDTAESAEAPKKFVRGIIPTIDGTRLDDEEQPSLDVSGKADVTVWLIVQRHKCSSGSAEEPERIEATDRDDRPDIEEGELAVEIASFDLKGDEGSEVVDGKIAYRLRSDFELPYQCEGDTDSENDSDFGSDEASGDENGSGGSGGSGGSDDDPPPPPGCKVKMKATWVNKVSCFPAAGEMSGTFPCSPGPFTFDFLVTFTGTDPFDRPCPHWAYGVEAVGSEDPEEVWIDSSTRRVRFRYERVPACGTVTLKWRARGYGPLREDDGDIIPSCCGSLFSGSLTSKLLPPVCGCGCSSSGDFDGDGIPNDEDINLDGDLYANIFDLDVDGDGLNNDVDPDDDNDGIPDGEDPSPQGYQL